MLQVRFLNAAHKDWLDITHSIPVCTPPRGS
jgi:hypothetical protein